VYSRDEIKNGKELFWSSFGQYVAVIPSAEGHKINWVNYKTGIKHLFFRMDADQFEAIIKIEIAHPDSNIRDLQFATFERYRQVFEEILGEKWIWEKQHTDAYGKQTARIYQSIQQVNLYNQEDWPALISFFKPRIIALDEFWSLANSGFSIFK